MPSFKETEQSEFSIEQLFKLVMDVQSYPEFLPWCKDAKILSDKNNVMIAELTISFPPFKEKYISQIKYSSSNETAQIETILIEGPFDYLFSKWHFAKNGTGSIVDFEIGFQFKSTILNKLVNIMFERAVQKISKAFQQRAVKKYQ